MIKKLEIEKQSEQKPIKEHNACEFCEDRYGCVSPCSMKLVEKEKLAEVEPKFKVGQIIKKKSFNLGFIIVKIEDGFYYNNMGDYFPFTDQDNWQLVEQKSAWSEEDEEVINLTCSILYSNFNENENFDKNQMCIGEIIDKLKSLRPQSQWKPSDEHYELEEFAKIVRGNLTGISKAVQKLFEAKYLQLTGNKMYGGFKD